MENWVGGKVELYPYEQKITDRDTQTEKQITMIRARAPSGSASKALGPSGGPPPRRDDPDDEIRVLSGAAMSDTATRALPTGLKVKLAPLLRLQSSDNAGERANASAVIGRLLKNNGLDWHDLTEALLAEPAPTAATTASRHREARPGSVRTGPPHCRAINCSR